MTVGLTVETEHTSPRRIRPSPDCTRHAGTATKEYLAKLVEVVTDSHRNMITAVVTDCEPAMVKARRTLSRNNVTEHIKCAGHRLE